MQQEASDMQYSDLLEADRYINLDPTRRSKETATIRSDGSYINHFKSLIIQLHLMKKRHFIISPRRRW